MGLLQDCYISYVNLDHRTDRNQKMIESLTKVGIENYTRTRGMLPSEWPDVSRMETMLKRPQVGAIGCFLSQLKVMTVAQLENKHAFVLEDDVEFCSDFQDRIKYIENWIYGSGRDFLGQPVVGERDWDIIWLGGTVHIGQPYWDQKREEGDRLGRDAELTDDPRILRTYASFCTYAYIVNRSSISKVIELLEEYMSKSWGIDHSMIHISPKLKTYAFIPGCCKQYDNLSDQIPSKKHVTEFSRFERLNGTVENSGYWYQDKMEMFDPTTFDWKEADPKNWK